MLYVAVEKIMSFYNQEDEFWQFVSSVAQDEGLKLYDMELAGGSQLKISVTRASGESPNIDDCSKLVKRLMVTLHAEGENFGVNPEVQIDVSSPGIDRQLRTAGHFEEAIGQRIKIVCGKEVVSGGVIVGELKNFNEEVLSIAEIENSSEKSLAIKLSQVKKANVEFNF